MEGELTILSPIVQYIFAGLCTVLLAFLCWIIKRFFRERENDFRHIRKVLESLPCETHTEQLRQIEKRVNSRGRDVQPGIDT